MGFLQNAGRAVKYLFRIQTGIGGTPEPFSAGSDAVAAALLPLAGLAVGFVSAVTISCMQAAGMGELSALAGVTALSVLGGARQVNAMMGLSRRKEGFHGGVVLFTVLSVVFLVYGLNMLSIIYPAMLYLPVAGALAMVSAASVMPEPEIPAPLSSSKGLHMVLAAALTLVLMLPPFGLSSLAYASVAVMAGSLTALIGGRKEYRADLIYVAATVAELAFLLLLLLSNKPIIYY